MTVQTKHFIEPSDIIAVRIDCNKCNASVSLAIGKELTLNALAICPNCKRPWLKRGDASIDLELQKCIEAINAATTALDGWKESSKAAAVDGFTFRLEVKDDLAQ